MSNSGKTGLLFELHGNYYQITGRTNIRSPDARFDAARARLYQVFKDEWSGYQGVLRTGVYASNDGLAHLIAGKQVELLSDEQVAALIVRHLPQEAQTLLPASALSVAMRSAAALPALGAIAAPTGTAAQAAAGLGEVWWTGPWGIVGIAASAALIWWLWSAHSSLMARLTN